MAARARGDLSVHHESSFDTTHHIFPRLVLLTFVLAAPAARDLLSLDAWLGRRRASGGS